MILRKKRKEFLPLEGRILDTKYSYSKLKELWEEVELVSVSDSVRENSNREDGGVVSITVGIPGDPHWENKSKKSWWRKIEALGEDSGSCGDGNGRRTLRTEASYGQAAVIREGEGMSNLLEIYTDASAGDVAVREPEVSFQSASLFTADHTSDIRGGEDPGSIAPTGTYHGLRGSESVSKKRSYHIYGIVVDARAGHEQLLSSGVPTHSWHSTLLIADEDTQSLGDCLRIDHYVNNKEELLPVRSTGDIIRLHRVHVRRVSDTRRKRDVLQGRSYKYSSSILFSPDMNDGFVPVRAVGAKCNRHHFRGSDRARVRELRKYIHSKGAPSWALRGVADFAIVKQPTPFPTSFVCVVDQFEKIDDDRYALTIRPRAVDASIPHLASSRLQVSSQQLTKPLLPKLPCVAVIHEYGTPQAVKDYVRRLTTVLWIHPATTTSTGDQRDETPALEMRPILELTTIQFTEDYAVREEQERAQRKARVEAKLATLAKQLPRRTRFLAGDVQDAVLHY
ncbi:hypothetical protein NDN08_001515 [Rhodosorus marinus]|uniref:Telomeric single stranded DNA binding POT1/Cdc13 domain-containing protein n=1 Tax=Rhodosorus marinus TaxID=101924 RepID=A0AAV8UV63_9RHOD|nr:hypothetical protein NDN08_001515 [Rhodosorus marinus]